MAKRRGGTALACVAVAIVGCAASSRSDGGGGNAAGGGGPGLGGAGGAGGPSLPGAGGAAGRAGGRTPTTAPDSFPPDDWILFQCPDCAGAEGVRAVRCDGSAEILLGRP